MGTQSLIVFCFYSEDFYMKTRLQFDDTAQRLQNLERATRKAVCAAVKEFNKSQVCRALSGGEDRTQPLPRGGPSSPCPSSGSDGALQAGYPGYRNG